jgi:hypothetical protein
MMQASAHQVNIAAIGSIGFKTAQSHKVRAFVHMLVTEWSHLDRHMHGCIASSVSKHCFFIALPGLLFIKRLLQLPWYRAPVWP